MKLFAYLLPATLLFTVEMKAQDTLKIELASAITMAQGGSVVSKQIENNYQSSYWSYKAFKARQLPSLDFTGTLPDFNRTIFSQTQPDGTREFISSNVFNSDVGLNLSQRVAATGGSVFLNSGLQRIDNLDEDDQTSYFSNPVSIGFNQSIFGFNSLRWEKKTAPLRWEAASRDKVEQQEQLSMDVVRTFFSYLLAQENLAIAQKNLENNEELYKIAKGRYGLGKIAENDLLQMELSVLQASNELELSAIQMERSKNELFTLLSIESENVVKLEIPNNTPQVNVNTQKALEQARQNRKDMVDFKRQKLEAERNLAEAKANRNPQINLTGSFGLNKTAFEVEEAYTRPLDQERFNLGLTIPIFDGGERKSQYKIAQSDMEVIFSDVEQRELAFDREVILRSNELSVLQGRLFISARSDTIALKRYNITKQRYLIGKIDITELNLALNSKDQSRRAYLQALRDYWEAYYRLRRLTLFDFETNQPLYKKLVN